MKQQFIITYLLAFSLLWGLGVFLEGRSIGAHWAKMPFEPTRRVSYSFPAVCVYILDSGDEASPEFVVVNEYNPSDALHPEYNPETEDRIIGVVLLYISWRHFELVGPFVSRSYYSVSGSYQSFDEKSVAAKDLDTAQMIAYHEARLYFPIPAFSQSEVNFHDVDESVYRQPAAAAVWTDPAPSMPWWVLITLFAFGPLFAASTITYATARTARGAR